MWVDIGLYVSLIGLAGSLFFNFKNLSKSSSKDLTEEIREITKMSENIKHMSADITEIKGEIKTSTKLNDDLEKKVLLLEKDLNGLRNDFIELKNKVNWK